MTLRFIYMYMYVYIYIYIYIYIYRSNQNPKTYNKYTKSREKRNGNTTLKKIIKPQRKRPKEDKRNKEELQKQP